MCRFARALILIVPALVSALATGACGGGGGVEQQILTNFFRASRTGDSVTLGNLSAVTLDPRKEGTVQDFEITSIAPEQRRKLQLAQLMEEEAAARKADSEFRAKVRAYQQANKPALDRVIKAENAKETVRGADVAVQTAWAKWLEEQQDSQRKISAARARVVNERAAAVDSLTAPGQADVDPAGMDVDIVTKDVTVNAELRAPSGETAPKTMVFTFQRAVGKTAGGEVKDGRWVITGLK